ncbi:MAG: MBL fold metallo-hydrolase [Phycisphaeraceae bacterium]|nr:MBL fold metallo-hydrolase [Phycisphaeraceae bacterium]
MPDPQRIESSALCVLASGSRGNCSALVTRRADGSRDVVLFDLGLSPRRTRLLLSAHGVDLSDVRAALVTHLDSDHCHTGWIRGRRGAFPLCLHESHAHSAARRGFFGLGDRMLGDDPSEIVEGVSASATIMSHDEMGVAAFRVSLPCGAELGYATDVGRPSPLLAQRLAGVDVLAIESNYCPYLQKTSQRPAWLKRRIMGGSGHLSNAQSAELVRAIAPRGRVVLLHLSQECNRPEVALRAHDTGSYDIVVSAQEQPTGWIEIERTGVQPKRNGPAIELVSPKQQALFGAP